MKTTLITLLLLAAAGAVAQEAHDWENNHVLQMGREPARAFFLPFGSETGDRQLSLNGLWKFRWTKTPDERVKDFWRSGYDCSSWADFPVPANWEVNGYGTPVYASAGYTFKIEPPFVTREPKQKYTSYVERNPTGQYKRTFRLPAAKADREFFLRFEGVMSAFYVWVNGQRVGYSQGSMEASEFHVTRFLHEGVNEIAVEVYKYSDGSYLEDQDFWRFGGIHRDVTLYWTPAVRLRDFAVRTVRQQQRDYLLQVNPQFSVYQGQTGRGYRLTARLYDGERLVCADSVAADEVLDLEHKAARMNEWFPQRGYRKFNRMQMQVSDVREWTAETPYLYTLRLQLVDSLGRVCEQVRQRVGFRHVQISGGRLLVNGQPVRLRGVNRHEHDPLRARVMTDELMLCDLQLMKAAHINAVRLSHYPNVPRWYELCDSIGMYVMDEADCETHGLRGTLTSTPDWNDAFMDRVIRMAERDKNHPSIISWSLGNESGFGPNHAAMAGWLHEFDPTRFVHYEGAQGDPDPACVDVISRFYPRVMQEYLNPGIPEGSDQERAENARWERLLEIARRTNDTRPVLTSEYAHCMGNSLGNFSNYWREIYSHPRMLGGFIWDWVDQGIVRDGTVLYGGDFGDQPNLKAFCLNGVVMADRSLSAKYYEVQHVYSPVQFVQHGDAVYVVNRNHHVGLGGHSCTYTVVENGKPTRQGSLTLPDVAPGDSAVVTHLSDYQYKKERDARLNLQAGDVTFQFPLNDNLLAAATSKRGGKGTAFSCRLQAFRAPTDNDKSFGNWLAKDWTRNGLDTASVSLSDGCQELRLAHGVVRMTTQQQGSEYTFTFECSGDLPDLPRLGIVLRLPKDYNRVSWYGRGPWENYPDRKASCPIGRYEGTVNGLFTHYPRPQDNGNHEDCAEVVVRSGKKGLRVSAVDAPFSFSVLPYSARQLYAAAHDFELPAPDATYLSIDCAVLGLGNSSCGPGVLKKYTIEKNRRHVLRLRIDEVR